VFSLLCLSATACLVEGRIDFATFVSILDKHSHLEKCQQDIVDAFKAHDHSGHGVVPASELRRILTQFGDKMSNTEGTYFFLFITWWPQVLESSWKNFPKPWKVLRNWVLKVLEF